MSTNLTPTIRNIPGFPGYQIGDDGSFWSLWEQGGRGHGWRIGTTRRPTATAVRRNGYIQATLHRNGKRIPRRIHQLVLLAFAGPCPDGHEGRHLDGNQKNNHLDNLAWGTKKENIEDRTKHGRNPIGQLNRDRAKIKEFDIPIILALRNKGVKWKNIARIYNVSMAQLFDRTKPYRS
jgi:hypothetical protein